MCYNLIMKETREIIAENLVKLRKANGITQLELAEQLNYSDKAVSKWENGDTVPSIEVLLTICSMYGITLDYLVHENEEGAEKDFDAYKTSRNNKLIITLLAVSAVWILATVMYVYVYIFLNINVWNLYVWSVPSSAIVGLVFNGIWGRKRITLVLTSILIWSLLGSVYLSLLRYNLWLIFILGVPLQISAVLWAGLKVGRTKNKKEKIDKKEKKSKKDKKRKTDNAEKADNADNA